MHVFLGTPLIFLPWPGFFFGRNTKQNVHIAADCAYWYCNLVKLSKEIAESE